MAETVFEELKRYVRWSAADEAALRALAPIARPHFRDIAEEFYARLHEHDQARRVFSGPDQVERLKGTLCQWMELLFTGPWDEAYYHTRARIGRMHVKIGLPQRYMFSAMTLIRLRLQSVVATEAAPAARAAAVPAVAKILDLELAIMLETFAEAYVDKVQLFERQERDRLEHRLAISEARYEQIVENAWSLVSTFDEHGTILLINARCEEMAGIERSQAIGRSWVDVFVAPDERDHVLTLFTSLFEGRRAGPYEGLVPRPGNHARRVRWHFTTLPSGGERVVCAMGSDVTEERDMAVRARRAERLAALGTMAAGLAHEIRNPLNAAALQLTVMQRRLGRSDGADVRGAQQAAELVATEMHRLAGLVNEFLQFARPQPLKLARADLRSIARDLLALVQPEAASAGVELTLRADGAVFAQVDEERMKQVLLNLVHNAVEAVGEGGHVQVRVAGVGDGAHVEVEDDGPGLPSPDAPIFEPFFTTKTTGTGLGLAIVHRIVSDHGGRISVESRPGRTRFSVALPAV